MSSLVHHECIGIDRYCNQVELFSGTFKEPRHIKEYIVDSGNCRIKEDQQHYTKFVKLMLQTLELSQ